MHHVLSHSQQVDQARPHTDLGAWFDAHPELLLHKLNGKLFTPAGMGIPDWGQPAAVEAWANGIAASVKKGGFDGVFIDGYVYQCIISVRCIMIVQP